MLIFQVAVLSWVRTIANHSILYIIIFVFSYLLGLLAKIKCSISSSQPDLWDCKQLAYNWRLGNFMKPYCLKFRYSLLAISVSFLLAGMWPQYCSISESCRLHTYFTWRWYTDNFKKSSNIFLIVAQNVCFYCATGALLL